jgi:hypothetical protein
VLSRTDCQGIESLPGRDAQRRMSTVVRSGEFPSPLFPEVLSRLDIPPFCSRIALFQSTKEEIVIMRIVTNNSQAARLRDSGGALLPWSQCACR